MLGGVHHGEFDSVVPQAPLVGANPGFPASRFAETSTQEFDGDTCPSGGALSCSEHHRRSISNLQECLALRDTACLLEVAFRAL